MYTNEHWAGVCKWYVGYRQDSRSSLLLKIMETCSRYSAALQLKDICADGTLYMELNLLIYYADFLDDRATIYMSSPA